MSVNDFKFDIKVFIISNSCILDLASFSRDFEWLI